MLVDPLLLFARSDTSTEPELIEIFVKVAEGDIASAPQYFELCRTFAEQGSSLAMCLCSRFCAKGFGTRQSNEEAFKWAIVAADTGFSPGYFEVGSCYERGIGIAINMEKALYYYELAVETGYEFARTHLASLYHNGDLIERDISKAVAYAEKAAQAGESLAAELLARWYEAGDGVIKNEQKAAFWYKRASLLGDPFASLRLSQAYATGELGFSQNAKMSEEFRAKSELQIAQTE